MDGKNILARQKKKTRFPKLKQQTKTLPAPRNEMLTNAITSKTQNGISVVALEATKHTATKQFFYEGNS